MATVNDPALAAAVNERIRPAAELIYAVRMLALDDRPVLTTLAATVPADATVLDGQATSAFTGANLASYLALVQDLIAASSDPALAAAVGAAVVRPLDVILAGLVPAAVTTGNTVTDVINGRVRPRCRVLRAVRYQLQNHLNVLPPLLAGHDPADVIADGRLAEGVKPLTVGQVQSILAFARAVTDPAVNTTDRALAVDFGAGTPLAVGF